jgi:hypothetical protein
MKKTIILVALIFVSIVTMAQVQYGVRAGMTLSTYYSAQDIFKFKPGIHVGAVADIPIGSSKFSFVPGVYFADKGTKVKEYSSNNYNKETHYNYQLEIPLLFTYKFPINDKLSLKPQIGAYVAYGLFEITNWKIDYINTNTQPTEGTFTSYFYDYPFGLLFGANAGLSAFYNKYSFTLSCDISSISRLRKYPDICLFFSLGYNF